jgi:hypothetical protein
MEGMLDKRVLFLFLTNYFDHLPPTLLLLLRAEAGILLQIDAHFRQFPGNLIAIRPSRSQPA